MLTHAYSYSFSAQRQGLVTSLCFVYAVITLNCFVVAESSMPFNLATHVSQLNIVEMAVQSLHSLFVFVCLLTSQTVSLPSAVWYCCLYHVVSTISYGIVLDGLWLFSLCI